MLSKFAVGLALGFVFILSSGRLAFFVTKHSAWIRPNMLLVLLSVILIISLLLAREFGKNKSPIEDGYF